MDPSVKSITVSGIRCQDMRLRLKYVDIPLCWSRMWKRQFRDKGGGRPGSNLYVLVNYTALFGTRNILKRWRESRNENHHWTFIPDLLNLYGDRGNIQCLMKRCQWSGIEAETIPFELG